MKSQKKNNLKMKSQKKNYSRKNYSRKNKKTKKNVKKIYRTKKMSGGTLVGLILHKLLYDNPEEYKKCDLSNKIFNEDQVEELCTVLSYGYSSNVASKFNEIKVIQKNTNLEELNISNNNFDDEMLENFLSHLTLNTNLKTLNISKTEFNDDNQKTLGDLLIGNSTLITLDISECGITDEGAEIIADALNKDEDADENTGSQLTTLNISKNYITKKGEEFLKNITNSKCKIIIDKKNGKDIIIEYNPTD